MASAETIIGALVILQPSDEDFNHWTAKQEKNDATPNLQGNVDVNTLDVAVSATIAGVNTGNIRGSLQDGVTLDFDLSVAKGNLGLYLKNGNELWVRQHVPITFDAIDPSGTSSISHGSP
ncbi:hypothetical protein SAPIO_CDS6430 [Scedosporium apiospermum]|uniref:Uncharacterized protein n=1 Tax=Pseudallescheria apiosperma TaxID=563466 RepID=A0A084G3W5_PSEDA|nr:uncharacterized protein SAPIO_CDS6430 [Scedosporium apiospermum]KEZ42027.1 hypothetical protein SAPIO_CDS6430 [Scedosporium apiospermum]